MKERRIWQHYGTPGHLDGAPGRRLRTGGYRAIVVATDAAGNRSARMTVSFRVTRR